MPIIFIIIGFQVLVTSPDERLVYAIVSTSIILSIFLPFHLRVYTTSKGLHVKYTVSLGRNKFIKWDQIQDAILCDKGRGNDIHIILKNGSHTCFSPFGVDEKIVDYIKEKTYQQHISTYPKKETVVESDFEKLQKNE